MCDPDNLYTEGSRPEFALDLGPGLMPLSHGATQSLNDKLREPAKVLVREVKYGEWVEYGSEQARRLCDARDRGQHSRINACARCGYDPMRPPKTLETSDAQG